MLLDGLLTPERSQENVEKLQKEALREELVQRAVQAAKVTAEERCGSSDCGTPKLENKGS